MFSITLQNIQHISSLEFSVDLGRNGILAIVGKNGVGKTTLARAIRNLSNADTFSRTAGTGIFRPDSAITYTIDGESRSFTFDPRLGALNCRLSLPRSWRIDIKVELSIPSGERFNFFKSLSDSDLEIRRALALGDFATPAELIGFLLAIYPDSNFNDLAEIKVRRATYYCLRVPQGRYIREDYLSSGEYFLINLYKQIRLSRRLIFVDEIDISLDAAAQVRLIEELRRLCRTYQSNVVFTTHSLAMIRTLSTGELHYLSLSQGLASIKPVSYGYVNGVLYGFRGWDRYVLTEDDVLKEFLEYVIQRYCPDAFLSYLVIYVGGSGNVIDMLDQNAQEHFLAHGDHVIAVLDGDQRGLRPARSHQTYCVPIDSVEKALFAQYSLPGFPHRLPDDTVINNEPKRLFKELLRQRLMSRTRIYEFLCDRYHESIAQFSVTLAQLLGSPAGR